MLRASAASIGVLESRVALGIGRREPATAHEGEQDVAAAEGVVDGVHEVHPGRQRFDVHEDVVAIAV